MLWMNGLEIHEEGSGPPKEDGIWMDWWVEGTWNWSSGDLGVCPGSPIDVLCQLGKVTGLVLVCFFTHKMREMGQVICKVTCSSNMLTQICRDTILENKDRINYFRTAAYLTDFGDSKTSL